MKIKLTRDDTRLIQENIFPYLGMYLQMKVRETQADNDRQLNFKVIQCIFLEVKKILDKKLNSAGNKFFIKLSDAQLITLYKLLQAFPVKEDQYYLLQLRQRMINEIHVQMVKN